VAAKEVESLRGGPTAGGARDGCDGIDGIDGADGIDGDVI